MASESALPPAPAFFGFRDEWRVGRRWRLCLITTALLLVAAGHFATPVSSHRLHVVHVVLEKLFFVPILLAAVWFGLRGAIGAAAAAGVIYTAHVGLQWRGHPEVNIDQIGELATMAVVAGLAGVLMSKEKKALGDLAQLQAGTLLALVCALDAREHQTQAHSLRVCLYALRVAGAMGLRLEGLHVLAQAAILHDVGKIGIPDHVLLKPGPLDADEWRIMRQHPEIGRRILERIPSLQPAAEVIFTHHEKFDGSGYPRGLHGMQIPLEARIFAVVDVYDALTSDRPYRAASTHEEAGATIAAGQSKHFDPAVVTAFLQVPVAEWASLRQRADQYGGPGDSLAHLVLAASGEAWTG